MNWLHLKFKRSSLPTEKKFYLVLTHIKKWLSRDNNIAFHSKSARQFFQTFFLKQCNRVIDYRTKSPK